MNRSVPAVITIMLAAVLAAAVSASAAESSLPVIQPVMQKLPAAMQDLQAKFAAKDYFGTAEKFMDIAEMFKQLDKVTPDTGSKAKWDEVHGNLINEAFRGIGACGSKDDAGIKKAIGEIVKYKDEGHKLFIKKP